MRFNTDAIVTHSDNGIVSAAECSDFRMGSLSGWIKLQRIADQVEYSLDESRPVSHGGKAGLYICGYLRTCLLIKSLQCFLNSSMDIHGRTRDFSSRNFAVLQQVRNQPVHA